MVTDPSISSNEARIAQQHGPPTPSSSGSDQDYPSSEDDAGSNDEVAMPAPGSRKRKIEDEPIGNKRHCRSMPAIEDYIRSTKCNTHGHWHAPSQHDGERHTTLNPVEPALPQVQIHQYRGHSMGTPTVPLPSVFSSSNAGQYNDGAASPSHSGSAPSTPPPISGIPALLNPGSPNSNLPQLPPLSSVSAHAGQNRSFTNAAGLSGHQAHSGADGNIASVLQAHRQELQREVSHLTMLLNRTNAILSNIDHAMASVAQNGSGNADGSSPH